MQLTKHIISHLPHSPGSEMQIVSIFLLPHYYVAFSTNAAAIATLRVFAISVCMRDDAVVQG